MKRKLLLFLLLVGGPVIQTQAQCDCGTGVDGVFHATSNTTLAGGTYNYTSFVIDAGIAVTVTGSNPLIINCTGNITIDGTLDLSGGDGTDGIISSTQGFGGIAVAGGHNGGDGSFLGSGSPGMNGTGPGAGGLGDIWGGGGGGGYGAIGSNGTGFTGGPFGSGGVIYGNNLLVNYDGGSGGGGGSGGNSCGSGGGGAGGGILIMNTCDTLHIGGGGVLAANGGNGGSDGGGNCGGGGAGSGGTIWLIANRLENDGNIQAIGGMGGGTTLAPDAMGGDGAEGRIRLDYNDFSGTGSVSPAAGLVTTILSSTSSSTSPLCYGDLTGEASVTANGGGGFYQYSWTGGQTSSTITGLGAGENIVTITDTNGCTVIDTVTVTSPLQIASTGTSTDETGVSANDGTATATVTGGTSPYGYVWTPGGGSTPTITGLDTGNYIVVITDDNGCTLTDTVHVGQATSVYTTIADRGLSVYPNPASNFVTVTSLKAINGDVTIQLTDNLGRVVATEQYNNSSEYKLNTGSYATGNYILRIIAEGSISNVPISIVR